MPVRPCLPALPQVAALIKLLPPLNRDLLTMLTELLYLIVVHSHITRMDTKNLAIVLTPNLTRKDQPDTAVPLEQFFNALIMNKDTVLYVRTLKPAGLQCNAGRRRANWSLLHSGVLTRGAVCLWLLGLSLSR